MTASTWRTEAACVGRDDIDWFPGGSSSQILSARDRDNLRLARAVCALCPVQAECLAEVLADGHEQHGIRAGLTAPEREALLPRTRTRTWQPAGCGTAAGYAAHLRRGEQTCPTCRAAHSRDSHIRRRRSV
jgi:hypothetical protein